MLSVMSTPLTLLGLPEQGPSKLCDLKRDYDAFFGWGSDDTGGTLTGSQP